MPPVPPAAKRRIFGLDRNIFILGLTSFFNDFSNEMILAAFPAFFTSVLKSGAASLGMVEGIADGASNLLKIYSGHLSDKVNKHRIFIFFGYGLSVLVRPFYILMGSVSGVLGLRVLDRVGKGVREAPRDVIISVSSVDHDVGRSFGYHRAMDAAGGILGPLAAYFVLLWWPGNWSVFFMTAFVLGLIAFATIFFVKHVAVARAPDGSKLFSWRYINSLPGPFKWYLCAIFILSIGSLPIAVLLLKTTSIGLVVADIPLFYMVYSIAYSGLSFSAGKLSDKIRSSKVLAFGYVILIISYLSMLWAESPIALVVGFVILGAFSAATDAAQRAHVAHITPEYARGTAYGLLNGAVGFGAMIAGVLGGWLWQAYSPTTALLLFGGIVIIGLVVFYLSARKHKNV